MGRPIILIVGREITNAIGVRGDIYGIGRTYAQAITRAGGISLIVPPISELHISISDLLQRCDGIVLHGGGDVDPQRYGQDINHQNVYGINNNHDEIELAMVQAALTHDVPMLAICRGLQILNVACGGTLIQDLGNENHIRQYHAVQLDEHSRVSQAMKTLRPENCHSYHHQAIDELGQGLTVCGRADDGTIEAIEHESAKWIVGVQWHPEDSADKDSEQQKLFDALVDQT